jgi:hypothetical protein
LRKEVTEAETREDVTEAGIIVDAVAQFPEK